MKTYQLVQNKVQNGGGVLFRVVNYSNCFHVHLNG